MYKYSAAQCHCIIMTESYQDAGNRAFSALLRGSSTIIFMSLFAVLGLVTTFLFVPEMVGYYLIAFVGAGAHVAMRAIGNQPDSDTVSPPESAKSVAVLLFALFLIASVVVSVRLGLGVVVAGVIKNGVGQSTLTVFGAAVTPLFDQRLSGSTWWLSPSSLAAVAAAKIIICLLPGPSSGSDESGVAESLLEDTRRIDPM